MIPLNYHHLYYFWITGKTGSITKAGEELFLAQPTLSLQLKSLEKSLGKTLLVRRRDGVTMTPDGQKTFEFCQKIFTQGDALLRYLREGTPDSAPILRIGVAPSISRRVALQTLGAVAAQNSGLRAALLSAPEAELQSRLHRHTLDLAIAPFDISNSLGKDFRGRLTAEIPVSLVASPKLKQQLGPFPCRDREIPMLMRNTENPLRKDTESFLTRHRASFRVTAEMEDGYLLRMLAAEGRGVAAVNDLIIGTAIREGALVRLNKEPTGLKDRVWFICAVQPHHDAAVQDLLDSLMSRFKLALA